MGALKGSIAVRRYAVLDPLPTDVRRRFLKGLRAHCFMPLDPLQELDRSSGWVSILDGEDADLQPEKVFFVAAGGEQLRVTLRTDVLKPPLAEVRRQAAARAAEMEAAEGRALSRKQLRDLKDEVSRTLRLRAFPRVKLVDFVWDLDGQRLYLWSQTKAANETFIDLFVKSFGLKLEPEGPGRWARGFVDAKALARLEPTQELWSGFPGVRPIGEAPDEDAADGEEAILMAGKTKANRRARSEPTLREEIEASGETPLDAAEAAERADRDDLQYLGREFLTWLVYHADVDGGAFGGEGDINDFTIAFGGRLTLRTPSGMVTDMTLKGPAPSLSADLRYALAGGLSVKEADLRLEQDERVWTFGLAAEHFDLKRVKLPALLTEEDDDKADERITLLKALDAALSVAFGRFLALRAKPAWTRTAVPALRAWLDEGT